MIGKPNGGMIFSKRKKTLMTAKIDITAKMEPFDSFWEAPKDIEKGFASFGKFYKRNYLKYIPDNKQASVLIISCGPGYFLNLLREEGYQNILGIDSDEKKLEYAQNKNLNCEVANAFDFLENSPQSYDIIIAEQEINHLTKVEILQFLALSWSALKENGILVIHSLNGANPITGSEALAQNFDHYNTLTEYSLEQALKYNGFYEIKVFPLKLYIFYENPLNYIGITIEFFLNLLFRLAFILQGKSNKIFTKKIAAVCRKKQSS
jgi:2-polyprenyl-3-methyl-5-hydroxy-6-metoxy-1,4-benzoquinol methylase